MNRSHGLVLTLIAAGLIANNYVFLHDVLWDKYNGWTLMGWKTYLVAGLGFAAVLVGVAWLARRRV